MRKISFKEFSTIRNYTATLGHKVSTHYYQKKKMPKNAYCQIIKFKGSLLQKN